MAVVGVPSDISNVLDEAWNAAKNVPGFLLESEARFLGQLAACTHSDGAIVEIGSFKGKSTIVLAKVAKHYSLAPVVAIDPHNFNSSELSEYKSTPSASSFDEFMTNIERAGVEDFVDVRRAYSRDVFANWSAPIDLLWIDGDHTYQGAKSDFDGFMPNVVPGGVVALHDALHEFSGPIRVFVEEVLRSDRFGPAGFVGSIAWAQYRPNDGNSFRKQRASLERFAAPLIPYLHGDKRPRGLKKICYKILRAGVRYRSLISTTELESLVIKKSDE